MENEKHWIWTDEYLIASYDVNAGAIASPTTLARFFQETAYNHAYHLEFGYEHLKANNQSWILSRLLVKIERYPQWREKIRVMTWPSGVDGLFAFRDFKILAEDGTTISLATSAWLILDSEKHRPLRPDSLKALDHLIPSDRALERRPSKLNRLANPIKNPLFPVRYSDIDLYNHVNNVKYIQWIIDSFPPAYHSDLLITEFEINFLSEAKLGDNVSVHTENTGKTPGGQVFLHAVKRESDDREVILARTIWNSMACIPNNHC